MTKHNNLDINGWIILDKPEGLSSNQVLRKIQYELKAKKAGHIGTLDPFASGVLPLAFGEATKLIPYLENGDKTYEFELEFGTSTTTDDTEGEILSTSNIIPSLEEIKEITPQFIGKITQIPPKYSAIHINGQRAYTLAREGKDFKIPERKITITSLILKSYQKDLKKALFEVTCSKGTYVRTLGSDIAKSLNTVGHLSSLRRTKNAKFDLSHTILLDNLKNMLYKNGGANPVLPVETFLCDITVIALTKTEALKLKNGQAIDSKGLPPQDRPYACCLENKLIALCEVKENHLLPIRVFNH
ncbi:MAG: tRNA pseudouridine(55) synthase TruB [Alphaproteobacteria bacterium]|nr:tRNA pseudouridine(55) synthase TruB [Alphaproteobacteria bacterium]